MSINIASVPALSSIASPVRWYFPLTSGYSKAEISEKSRQYVLFDAEEKVKNPSLFALESEINRHPERAREDMPIAAQWDMVSDEELGRLTQHQLLAAQKATQALRRIPLRDRIEVLQAFGTRLRTNPEKWRSLTAQESYSYNTFLVSLDAILEIFKPEYFDFIEEILQPRFKPGSRARLEYSPQGVLGVISPQNSSFPMLTQVLHGAFLAGNALLIKPPHRLALVALALVDEFNRVLKDYGMPDHLLNTVIHPNTQKILGHWLGHSDRSFRIDNLVFIGNSKRRDDILKICQQAGIFNPIIELEGVDAAYIHGDLTDALLRQTARLIAHAKNSGSGQFCVSLKRLYVHPEIYDPFMGYLRDEFQRYQPGSLKIDNPYILGPSALPHKLPSIVAAFEQSGARVTLGGRRLNYHSEPDPEGLYIEPTLFEDVAPDCDLLQSEIFANVLPVVKTPGRIEDAITSINACPFGLRASIFAQDLAVIEEMRHSLRVGTIIANGNPLDCSIQIAGGQGGSTLDQHTRIWPIDLCFRQVVSEGCGIKDLDEVLHGISPKRLPSLEGMKVHAPDRL